MAVEKKTTLCITEHIAYVKAKENKLSAGHGTNTQNKFLIVPGKGVKPFGTESFYLDDYYYNDETGMANFCESSKDGWSGTFSVDPNTNVFILAGIEGEMHYITIGRCSTM
ncbi:hypothetical protein [Candidatus Colwellia aromaticivorans]|uniref:hypothetical protein n=1 Tax=Candidatus Colwellia aromaticivorans TaxID=2267621 RepID=UPI000DF4841D|nr:hypothetical protein [Candidatus Colwellia aromaticivorans]